MWQKGLKNQSKQIPRNNSSRINRLGGPIYERWTIRTKMIYPVEFPSGFIILIRIVLFYPKQVLRFFCFKMSQFPVQNRQWPFLIFTQKTAQWNIPFEEGICAIKKSKFLADLRRSGLYPPIWADRGDHSLQHMVIGAIFVIKAV